MKPVLTILAVLCIFFVSCTSDNEVLNSTEVTTSETMVVKTLKDYNGNLMQNAHSRSIGKIGWFKVAVQDARGAYKGARRGRQIGALFGPNGAIAGTIVGGAILGGAKSYSAYKKMVANAEVAPYSYAPITAPVEPMTPIKSFEFTRLEI